MAGRINLKLLTDFFNKIGHEKTSPHQVAVVDHSVPQRRCLLGRDGAAVTEGK